MRVLITGAGGLVGRAVSRHCAELGDEALRYEHRALDISDKRSVESVVGQHQPDTIINCAAWTDVDGCERDPDRAMLVNSAGPENLAAASRKIGASLITISTDYVFDGSKSGFYTQRDDPFPQSVYGRSKLDGERRAQAASARTVIVRTGFIFGHGGTNYLSTVVERARRGEKLKAISDASGSPTYARHLATRLRELALLDLPGVFHIVNSGEGASYEEFTRAALRVAGLEVPVESISADSLGRPAPRPRNSRLKCLLSPALGLAPLPSWQDALPEFVMSQSGAAAPSL